MSKKRAIEDFFEPKTPPLSAATPPTKRSRTDLFVPNESISIGQFSVQNSSNITINISAALPSLSTPSAFLSSVPPSALAAGALTMAMTIPLAEFDLNPPPGSSSKALRELFHVVTPEIARQTLLDQLTGLPGYKRRPTYDLATTNELGCWIAALEPPKGHGEHVGVRPSIPELSSKGLSQGTKFTKDGRREQQFLHRLSIRAWGSQQDLERMFSGAGCPRGGKWEVSHLCSNAKCFRPNHLVVESHSANERRKSCLRGAKCQCRPHCQSLGSISGRG